MKKLFALLSTFVLTLAIVGLSVKSPAQAASSDKWTVDPTLAEDEIPMYEMGSIYTTFPNFYDNAAKPDDAWGGTSRMYPWNETRLRVAQYDENGAATGKYYAIYFSGLTSNVDSNGDLASGAGNNINGYAYNITKDDAGNVTSKVLTTVRVKSNTYGTDKEKYTYNSTPADPSLSHIRYNFTGEDIAYDGIALGAQIGDSSNAMNFYNRMFVVDGEGRIIRGVGLDSFYLKAGAEGAAADVWAPEFCYVDGVVTKYVEGETVCDKVKEEQKDENGDPVLGEDGKPVYVLTDEDNFLYKRFVWEWFEEMPTNVNTASWKAEGWDCDLWDLVIEDPTGGYLAIAFINAEGTNHKINDEEREVTNATRKAAGQAELAAGDHYRECVREIRVPAGGATFDFGYLDKQVATEVAKFNNIIRGSFYSGRTVGTAEYRTYNFSTTGLKINEKVVDGYSYQLMDQTENYVEVMQGVTFNPAAIVNYQGLASVWKENGNVLSYSKDLEALEYTMYVSKNDKSVDGDMVVYKYAYADKAEMIADFEKDVREFFAPGTAAGGEAGKFQDFTVSQTQSVGWSFISTSYNANTFWGNADNRTKWAWMVNYVATVRKASGLSTSYWETIDQGLTASPGTFNAEIQAFLTDTQVNPGAWNRTSDYSVEENANGFLPSETNQESFIHYSIDTTEDNVGDIYTVKFVVENKVGGSKDTMVIHYVVADSYTPIIEVNTANTYVYYQDVDGKKVLNAIDKMTLVTAYTAKYNGKTIKGNDITHNVTFESDTLDFNKPTSGTHRVTAKVVWEHKEVVKQFNVVVEDIQSPYVEFADSLVLEYGAVWSPKLLVKSAVDNVDGNLLISKLDWCVDESTSTKVNTTKPGDYNVKVGVYDAAGNSTTSKKIVVTVLPKAASVDDLKDIENAIADVASSAELTYDAVTELPKIEEIQKAVDDAGADVAAGCNSSSATAFIQLLAAGSLLVFLLRKKH